ncbi:DUF6086 family protein [Streptosporangium saharense]|uniref:DUF6086 family protein n=1 Tax=Streptosporangium saharense TaxID=1706840 RepID=UPI0034468E12
MSYLSEVGEETVWSPALRVGKACLSLLRSISELLGQPSGVVEISGDMCAIDVVAFETLTRRMFQEYFVSSHMVYREPMSGILAVSVVMLERSGRVLVPGGEENAGLSTACGTRLRWKGRGRSSGW